MLTLHDSTPEIHEQVAIRYSDGEEVVYIREKRPLVVGLGLWATLFFGLGLGLVLGAVL